MCHAISTINFKNSQIHNMPFYWTISREWMSDYERLCAMEPHLRLKRFLPQVDLEPRPVSLRPVLITHCIPADSSTVICWTSPFVILGVSGLLSLLLMENPVSKLCRP